MTEILIKLFIVCSQWGFVPYKKDNQRIHFHGTFDKAVAEITVDILEGQKALIFFYDLKKQQYLIIDSTEAFDYPVVKQAFWEAIRSAKAILPPRREKQSS